MKADPQKRKKCGVFIKAVEWRDHGEWTVTMVPNTINGLVPKTFEKQFLIRSIFWKFWKLTSKNCSQLKSQSPW